MKYTIDWCLFQYQFNNATTQSRQCGKTCAGPEGAMRIAMTDRVLQTNATIQYQYCESGDGAFESNVDDCVSCLEDVPSSMALANCMFLLSQLANHTSFHLLVRVSQDPRYELEKETNSTRSPRPKSRLRTTPQTRLRYPSQTGFRALQPRLLDLIPLHHQRIQQHRLSRLNNNRNRLSSLFFLPLQRPSPQTRSRSRPRSRPSPTPHRHRRFSILPPPQSAPLPIQNTRAHRTRRHHPQQEHTIITASKTRNARRTRTRMDPRSR